MEHTVKIAHTVEYEVTVEGDTVEELHANAVNELIHSNASTLAGRATGNESWKISGLS